MSTRRSGVTLPGLELDPLCSLLHTLRRYPGRFAPVVSQSDEKQVPIHVMGAAVSVCEYICGWCDCQFEEPVSLARVAEMLIRFG